MTADSKTREVMEALCLLDSKGRGPLGDDGFSAVLILGRFVRANLTPSAPLPEAGEVNIPYLIERTSSVMLRCADYVKHNPYSESEQATLELRGFVNEIVVLHRDIVTALAARTPQPAAPNEAEDAAEAMRIVGIVAAGTISIVNMRDAQALVERAAMRGESRG
jgi:hypothetical protein